jgi:hypothetical protein
VSVAQSVWQQRWSKPQHASKVHAYIAHVSVVYIADHFNALVQLILFTHFFELDALWTITANQKLDVRVSSAYLWNHVDQQIDSFAIHKSTDNDDRNCIAPINASVPWCGAQLLVNRAIVVPTFGLRALGFGVNCRASIAFGIVLTLCRSVVSDGSRCRIERHTIAGSSDARKTVFSLLVLLTHITCVTSLSDNLSI